MRKLPAALLRCGLCTIVAALAACTAPQVLSDQPVRGPTAPRVGFAGQAGSWMLPEAKHEDLLYVSKDSSTGLYVEVYAYKTQRLVGTLTGVESPWGQCVDAAGDVWITNWAGSGGVVEYAHGGSTPIKTLATASLALGCSVSPNGDLVVMSEGNSDTLSLLEVFKNASGTPTTYQSSECAAMGQPGYDGNGNLYVEGKQFISSYSFQVNVCELPAGGKNLRKVSFDHPLGLGPVMWDGKHITISGVASGHSYIFRAREGPSGDLTTVGSTHLLDDGCANGFTAAQQIFIVGKANTPVNHTLATAVVGGNTWFGCQTRFDAWHYPAGGNQKWSFTLSYPSGQAVSLR